MLAYLDFKEHAYEYVKEELYKQHEHEWKKGYHRGDNRVYESPSSSSSTGCTVSDEDEESRSYDPYTLSGKDRLSNFKKSMKRIKDSL